MNFLNLFTKKEELGQGFVPNPAHDNDPRNLSYDDIAPLSGESAIPESFLLDDSGWFLNQNRTHSCTCHAAAHAVDSVVEGKQLSARHAYWRIKTNPKYASSRLPYGAYIRDAVLSVIEGVADYTIAPNADSESEDAYVKKFTETFSLETAARRNAGGSYIYVAGKTADDLERFAEMQRFIYEQRTPLICGIAWRTSYNNARKGGIVPVGIPTGNKAGHAMLAIGWKRINNHMYMCFKNSWGSDWGDKGKIWLPVGFFKFSAAGIAYLNAQKTEDIGIVVPPKVETPTYTRNIYREQANAVDLRAFIELKFPDNVPSEAKTLNLKARGVAGTNWLVLVPALTYLGWTKTDIVNWLWARSRSLTTSAAYNLDFTRAK